jgi:hypothetical protein
VQAKIAGAMTEVKIVTGTSFDDLMKNIQTILQTPQEPTKEKEEDVVHPLYKLIAEGDAKGVTELLEKSDNPKHILTSLVSLSKVPAKIEKRAPPLKFVTPFHAAILCYNADVLQALVDKAVELRILQECTEGRDLQTGDQKVSAASLNRPLYFALANCWYRGADILFKAGSGLFAPDNRNPRISMILFLMTVVFKTDDVVALQWLCKHGLGSHFGPSDARVSLFHMAAAEGALGCMQIMLARAIQNKQKQKTRAAVVDEMVNEINEGETPLCSALRYKQHNVTRWLLMHGAHKDLDKALELAPDDQFRDVIRETRQAYLDSLLEDT